MRDFSFLTPIVWCILITEAAERFAYFGFRAVLVLYFKEALLYEDSIAISFSSYTICLAYLSPLLGAVLADGAWGRYKTILIFGWVYAAGLAILTLSAYLKTGKDDDDVSMQRSLTFLGLFLICLGTGGIKPCVSAFGADQVAHADAQQHKRQQISEDIERTSTSESPSPHEAQGESGKVRAFFAAFYFCINVGAVLSFVIVPVVRARWGFGAAFLCPTLFLLIAMVAFLSKRKDYVHTQNPSSSTSGVSSLTATFTLCWWLIRQRLVATRWISSCCPCLRPKRAPIPGLGDEDRGSDDGINDDDDDSRIQKHVDDRDEDVAQQMLSDAKQTLHVLPVMLMFPVFWMLYDQQGSVWTLQATRMKLGHVQPEQLNVVNPLEIMLFIPLFDRIIYPALEQRAGIDLRPLRRMRWGMMLGSVAFFISGFLETTIETNGENTVSVFWQLPQITIITIAEIFLSVTGMEFSYSTSPERLKALLMSLYLLMTAIGDFMSGTLYASVFSTMNRATVMHICALLLLINMALFTCVAQAWERREEAKRAGADDLSSCVNGLELLENHKRPVEARENDLTDPQKSDNLRLV